ncbi:unnamed protein product [Calicophoron daubneyi]|uniref:Chloride channel CLIC-like protein 1 n=1 Tax=Calicophoron daubneyi TaxID=300641 RepID=A0AAV2TQV7_CALDB
MFGDGSAAIPANKPVSDPESNVSSRSVAISSADHYRELHRILARILWNTLKDAESLSTGLDGTVKIRLVAALKPEDVKNIKNYCSSDRTKAESVSPDVVNAIFSRTFGLVAEPPTSEMSNWPEFLKPIYILILLASILIFLSCFFVGVKRLLLRVSPLVFFVAVVTQSLYRKYNERLAHKMSVLARHSGPPEECKPEHLRSWRFRFSNMFNLRPHHDPCAQYYEELMTEPWFAASLYEVLCELVLEPCIWISRTIGRSVGVLYNDLSLYVPVFLVLPLMALLLLSIPVTLLLYMRFLSPVIVRRAPKRRHRPQIKSHSVPSIKSDSSSPSAIKY